jgi:hypothetical protein
MKGMHVECECTLYTWLISYECRETSRSVFCFPCELYIVCFGRCKLHLTLTCSCVGRIHMYTIMMWTISPSKSINISIVGRGSSDKNNKEKICWSSRKREELGQAHSTQHWSIFSNAHMCRQSAYIPQSIIDRKKMC